MNLPTRKTNYTGIGITTFFATTALLAGSGFSEAQAALISGIESFTGGFNAGTINMQGFRFRATEDATVTALGVYDIDGDGLEASSGVRVGLWDDIGTLLGEVLVQNGTASPIQDSFRYETLTSGIDLTSGSFYRVGAAMTDITGTDFVFGAEPTTVNKLDSIQGATSADSLFEFPAVLLSPDQANLGGNVFFEGETTSVPEPSLLLGLLVVSSIGTLFKL
ncbi:MAG: hypothetical protein AB4041_04410 [Microcystaceae cyanobacterium]